MVYFQFIYEQYLSVILIRSPYSNLLAIADSEGHVTLQKLTAEASIEVYTYSSPFPHSSASASDKIDSANYIGVTSRNPESSMSPRLYTLPVIRLVK